MRNSYVFMVPLAVYSTFFLGFGGVLPLGDLFARSGCLIPGATYMYVPRVAESTLRGCEISTQGQLDAGGFAVFSAASPSQCFA